MPEISDVLQANSVAEAKKFYCRGGWVSPGDTKDTGQGRVVWLTVRFSIAWRSGTVSLDWLPGNLVPIFLKVTTGFVPVREKLYSSLAKSMVGFWREDFILCL